MSSRHLKHTRLRVECLEERQVLTGGLTSHPLVPPSAKPSLAAIPNDSRFTEQWGLQGTGTGAVDIGATRAWDVTTGSTRANVAVLDTGVDYTHPDLYRNIWLNQGEIPTSTRARLIDTNGDGLITFIDLNDDRNQGAGKISDLNRNGYIDAGDVLKPIEQGGWADGISNDGDQYVDDLVGWNFVSNTNDPFDDHGHGTHVSGIIGAEGNNSLGVSGVAWSVPIMGLKIFDARAVGDTSWAVKAVDYAATHGAKVINVSWILASFSTNLAGAISRAEQNGVVIVAAAGNNGQNIDVSPTYPANSNATNVMTVAALDIYGKLASYSNFGVVNVDIAAPGSNILSTNPGKSYGYRTGSSMAAPFVSGVVALVWASHPTWSYKQVISQVLNTATRRDSLIDQIAGGRIINAAAAVGVAQPLTASSPPKVMTAVAAGPTPRILTSFRITFDRPMSFSSLTRNSVSLTLPNGQQVTATNIKDVAGSAGKSFDLIFPLQSRTGSYQLQISNVAKDLSGLTMAEYSHTVALGDTPPAPSSTAPRVVMTMVAGPTPTTISSFRISFDRAMNFSTLSPMSVTLSRPTGVQVSAINVKDVAGSGGRGFDLIFPLQSLKGTYTLRIAALAKDNSGLTMEEYTFTTTL